MDAAAAQERREAGDEDKKRSDNAGKVPFAGLFRYADGRDVLLMVVGTAAALANGMAQPLMVVIFGQVINAFGGATTDTILERVNKVSLHAGVWPASFLICVYEHTPPRQSLLTLCTTCA